ncbi:tRNA pseudouridine synthase D [Geobacter sp. OR-1]|uniref:tRNA pseudouridine(13) synthase TruD n=1 Tax=Geobacter sp. OR-1 TaxID=1266765 RepID=UPI000543D5A4|nr:tRNA pseudouridine(13) synthase TruD [Geobacter sp. OR-1]GAM08980.1 tRNA pseudouridine synthase D [Geobacter sp. OR-1]
MTTDKSARPYLTPEIPGIGGILKESAEDFMVEEIPLYQPCGEGEHLYLEIEKRGITTLEAIRRIGRVLKIQERDIGYAGMKDAKGITRQTLSLPRVPTEQARNLDIPGIRVLAAARHKNKLKLGHLAANRFQLVIRGVAAGAAERAESVLKILGERGVPNIFGPQRYGIQGNSHLIGRALLCGDHQGAIDAIIGDTAAVTDERWQAAIEAYRQGALEESLRLFPGSCRTERDILQRLADRPDKPDKALHAVNPRLKSLYLSAWQSALFDRIVWQRIGRLDLLEPGDLAWKHVNGACFLVEDAVLEAPRAADFEISPSGPLFGASMTWPAGAVRAREEQILASEGLTPEGPANGWPQRLDGARRPLRVPLAGSTVSEECSDLIVGFTLPKGSYATAVLREVMKDW